VTDLEDRPDGEPLLSVVMPVFNERGTVLQTIAAVRASPVESLELIVVDDGSTDGTAEVVRSFGDRVRLIAGPAAGAYPARNAGLRAARGELVAFIDSDDAWLPDKLARQVPLMRPGISLVYGDAIHVGTPQDGAPPIGGTSFASPPCRGRVADAFAWCNFVPTCTVLARRSALEAVGGFSEAQLLSADYLAWFRIALRGELDFVDAPVADYTVHADGISADLGRSLEARLQLFQAELAETRDPATRALLRRLVFNLSLHLAVAALRGRARNVRRPLQVAWRAGSRSARLLAAPWAAAFAANQARARARRLFA
jgi:glycosyltransferase involved in cell wall biosynthesis